MTATVSEPSRLRRVLGSRSAQPVAGLVSARLLAAVFSAGWYAVAARHLSLPQFSDLTLVLAVGAVLFFVGDAGFSLLLSAHVAATSRIELGAVRATVARRVVGTLVAVPLVSAAYLSAASTRSLLVPLTYGVALLANAVHTTCSAALRGIGHVGPEAVSTVGSRVAVLIGGAWWLAHGGGLLAAIATYALADVVVAVGLAVVVRSHGVEVPGVARPDLRLRRVVPLAVGAGFTTTYAKLDTWLVASVGPVGAAGLYGAAYRLLDASLLPSNVLGSVAVVRVGSASSEGERRAAVRRFVAVSVATAMAPTLVLVAAAPAVMRIVYGKRLNGGTAALRLLALSIPFGAVVAVLLPLVAVASGRHFARAVGAALAANTAANLVLIPRFGASGAAAAFLGSQVLLAAFMVTATGRTHAGWAR